MSYAMPVSGAENIHSLYRYSVATTKELPFFEFPPPKTYYLRNMIKQQRNN
jgi:hypothetical protein